MGTEGNLCFLYLSLKKHFQIIVNLFMVTVNKVLRLFRINIKIKILRGVLMVMIKEEVLIPKKHDIDLAAQSSKEFAAVFPRKEKDFRMTVKTNNHQAEITFPFSSMKLLLEILTQMAEGNAITIIPVHAELTTQEAANLLNISRPYLIRLLEEGKIAFHKVGTHRRIRFKDLLQFRENFRKISQKALEELTEQAQELDMGY